MVLKGELGVAYVAVAKFQEIVQAKILTPDLALILVLEVIFSSFIQGFRLNEADNYL